jgi:hypothetical protein
MLHGSAFFQVKDKCISLVEINLIIQKSNMDFPYDLCTIENKDLIILVFETILKLGNPLKSKSKFTKSKIGWGAIP